jgi:hypothetical protein
MAEGCPAAQAAERKSAALKYAIASQSGAVGLRRGDCFQTPSGRTDTGEHRQARRFAVLYALWR